MRRMLLTIVQKTTGFLYPPMRPIVCPGKEPLPSGLKKGSPVSELKLEAASHVGTGAYPRAAPPKPNIILPMSDESMQLPHKVTSGLYVLSDRSNLSQPLVPQETPEESY